VGAVYDGGSTRLALLLLSAFAGQFVSGLISGLLACTDTLVVWAIALRTQSYTVVCTFAHSADILMILSSSLQNECEPYGCVLLSLGSLAVAGFLQPLLSFPTIYIITFSGLIVIGLQNLLYIPNFLVLA